MWRQLDSRKVEIVGLVRPLLEKAAVLNRPWSLIEAGLTPDDIAWLHKDWFAKQDIWTVEYRLTKFSPVQLDNGVKTQYSALFAALLLTYAAYECREHGREDRVWPVVRRFLSDFKPLSKKLFHCCGQPKPLLTKGIVDAVRLLNLRNVLDREGTLQWFITVKLQFGFTLNGAKNRLAEWLVGFSRPNAVEYLLGESGDPTLKSDSFAALWNALRAYRRDEIDKPALVEQLRKSPWVAEHWIEELATQARSRIETLGRGDASGVASVSCSAGQDEADGACPVERVALIWPRDKSPRLRLRLDRDALLEQLNTDDESLDVLDIYVDDHRVCRWKRQPSGWSGEVDIYAEPDQHAQEKRPNLRPETLAVRTRTGETLGSWSLAKIGLGEDVLIFDCDRNEMLGCDVRQWKPTTRYVVLCDPKAELSNCEPTETFAPQGLGRKALCLPCPHSGQFKLVIDGFPIWQCEPVQQASAAPSPALRITTPGAKVFGLGERTVLHVEGLPFDAGEVEMLVHQTKYAVERVDGVWRTAKEVQLTPEWALGRHRLCVRYRCDGRTRTSRPQLALRLYDAVVEHKGNDDNQSSTYERVKDSNRRVNTTGSSASLHVWAPTNGREPYLFEDDIPVGVVKQGKTEISLWKLPNFGGMIRVYVDGGLKDLGVSFHASGVVSEYVPSSRGEPKRLKLYKPLDREDVQAKCYCVYAYLRDNGGQPRLIRLPPKKASFDAQAQGWNLTIEEAPLALAVAYKSAWVGAWWNLKQLEKYLREAKQVPASVFAVLKWLRVPVLAGKIEPAFAEAVKRFAASFIQGWWSDDELPQGLYPHNNLPYSDDVVRHFVWNLPSGALQPKDVVGEWKQSFDPDEYCGRLKELMNVSLMLLNEEMETCKRHFSAANRWENVLKLFATSLVGLGQGGSKQAFLARLSERKKLATAVTGLDLDRMDELVREIFVKKQMTDRDKRDFRLLGQTYAGREYMAYCLATRRAGYPYERSRGRE